MPVPSPQPGETQSEFLDRCVAVLEDEEDDDPEGNCQIAWDDRSGLKVDPARTVKTTAAPPPAGDPLQYVMSDATIDRMGDVIEPGGWQLENFRRNPVALFGHNPDAPIGTWRDVAIDDGQLRGRLELMPAVSERLRELHAAVAAGVLRAVSVGFRPVEYEPLENSKSGGLRFTRAELVECSLVSVPANPNALAVAKALRLSRETQRLIFGGLADNDQRVPIRGRTGGLAVTHPKSGTRQMELNDRIKATQESITTLQDQVTALLAKTPELDEETTVACDELNLRIERQAKQLDTLKRAENSLALTSEIIVPQNAVVAQPRPFAMPKREQKPGELLIRALIAHGVSTRSKKPHDQVLGEYGWADDMGVRTCLEWVGRAATAPATTTTTGWAAELVQTQYSELLAMLTVKSVYQPLSAMGVRYTLGRYGQISIPVESATPTVAGSFVLEGAPIPVRQEAFTPLLIGLKKMAVISSFTRELFEHSQPNIDTQLRDRMGRDTSVSIDTVLLDNTAVSATRPAGLRAGVAGLTPTPITGGAFAALVADLKALVNVLITANSLRSPVWIMNPQQAFSIAATQSSAGVGVFPFKAEIESGLLFGYPVIQSSTVPVTMVILLDAADFASITGDDARFELSDQATLHMEDTTPLPIGTPGSPATVAAPVRSMFQTDSIALRMIMPMNWAMRRTGLVAWVTGVTW